MSKNDEWLRRRAWKAKHPKAWQTEPDEDPPDDFVAYELTETENKEELSRSGGRPMTWAEFNMRRLAWNLKVEQGWSMTREDLDRFEREWKENREGLVKEVMKAVDRHMRARELKERKK